MNKTKIVFLIFIIVILLVLGYIFVIEKTNIFIQPSKLPPGNITFNEIAGGCGDIFVYKINNDDTAGISVWAVKEKLNISATEKTFKVGKTDGLNVEVFMGDKIRTLYCSDLDYGQDRHELKKLIGTSGEATIFTSDINDPNSRMPGNYTATIILKDVHFSDEKGIGSDFVVNETTFKNVRVGWYAD